MTKSLEPLNHSSGNQTGARQSKAQECCNNDCRQGRACCLDRADSAQSAHVGSALEIALFGAVIVFYAYVLDAWSYFKALFP